MSTNPFRRSSLRASSSSTTDISSSNPIDIPHDKLASVTPLSVNTKAIGASQKHVNFASPPGIPISPVSYPSSSPESTRISPPFHTSQPITPSQFNYGDAIQSNPFQAEAATGADDGAIEEALTNTRANVNIAAPDPKKDQNDAVRATLSRFASAPRRPQGASSGGPVIQQGTASNRQTMDVDAFKRLLMTGEPGNMQSIKQDQSSESTVTSGPANISESSSSADTVSTTFRSMFDQRPGITDTSSLSSASSEDSETESAHVSQISAETLESKVPPPPPKSRHGKSLTEKPIPTFPSGRPNMASTVVPTTISATENRETSPVKQPPPPPLARRRSQHSESDRNTSSQHLQVNDKDSSGLTPEIGPKAPPPPPSRRPGSLMERRTSTDLPTTLEEPDIPDVSGLPSRKASDTRPPPPPARHSSSSKRASLGVIAPPLPPPRRGRGSSRSSIDSQRPFIPAATDPENTTSARSSVDLSKPAIDIPKKVSQSSSTNDIMAELAALQKEVDDARRSAG